jgi:hypothetical protein
LIFGEGGKPENLEKGSRARERINNRINSYKTEYGNRTQGTVVRGERLLPLCRPCFLVFIRGYVNTLMDTFYFFSIWNILRILNIQIQNSYQCLLLIWRPTDIYENPEMIYAISSFNVKQVRSRCT